MARGVSANSQLGYDGSARDQRIYYDRGELTDQQWSDCVRICHLKTQTGRPANDHRHILNGILWILRTGPPISFLPALRRS
jgi:transposase